MWNSPQQLNMVSSALFGVSFLLLMYGALHFVLRLPEFNLRAVQLTAAPRQVDVAEIEAVVRNELLGNFFTVDLESTQRTFEKLPWVRKVSVRRRFPWQLEVDLEEHVALARWNGTELVNTHGEVFAGGGTGMLQQSLPDFSGQAESAAEITRMYLEFAEQLTPLKREIVQINLSPRRAWQLRLNNGLLLKLGRDQSQQRLERFVAAYLLVEGKGAMQYVDLRYRNGFAVMYKQSGHV